MYLPASHDNQGGFTLIEFLVAILILMVGLLALLETVNFAIIQNNSTKMRNDAVLICDQAMGLERGKLFSNLTSMNSVVTQKVGLGSISYSVVEQVVKLTNNSLKTNQIPGAKQVKITVRWQDKNQQKDHTITSTIVEPAN